MIKAVATVSSIFMFFPSNTMRLAKVKDMIMNLFIRNPTKPTRAIHSTLRGFPKVETQVSAAENSKDCVEITEARQAEKSPSFIKGLLDDEIPLDYPVQWKGKSYKSIKVKTWSRIMMFVFLTPVIGTFLLLIIMEIAGLK